MPRLAVDGKHFLLDGERCFLRAVTYGPFPEEAEMDDARELAQIAQAGFHAVRTYGLMKKDFLDLAETNGLLVIPTHTWGHGCDFIAEPKLFRKAQHDLEDWLRRYRDHPAVGAVLVGNEIPSDMARWMHPEKVIAKLDELIATVHWIAPKIPAAYASFPTTEYLEPRHADFTAFNLYLEDPEALEDYLPRLHHVAGDRPVFIAEFGLDTQRNSEEEQARLLPLAKTLCERAGLSGCTIYAWSDHWKNGGRTIDDWSFGLKRRDGGEKPAVAALGEWKSQPSPINGPKFTVIVCTRNGASRLQACLDSIRTLKYENFETLIINDGSTDGTRAFLDRHTDFKIHHLDPCGLSAARNYGGEQATGEILAFTDDDCVVDSHWLSELARAYEETDHAAIGGPNLSPPPFSLSLALTTAAPGAPTHVMLSDTLAEHLPGCHLTVRKSAFDAIGGFDPAFQTAGDDVDFCWRIRDAGMTLGFCGAAFVWHHRRATVRQYLKQQMGYGKAEALLFKKHPDRFGAYGIRWEGIVYQGNALGAQSGDVIYTGPAGSAPYQSLALTRQPERGLAAKYDCHQNRRSLAALGWLSRYLRAWIRKRNGGPGRPKNIDLPIAQSKPVSQVMTLTTESGRGRTELYRLLQLEGWEPCEENEWDLQLESSRLFAATEETSNPANRTFLKLHVTSTEFIRIRERSAQAGFELSKSETDHIYISKTS